MGQSLAVSRSVPCPPCRGSTMPTLEERIKEQARRLGFELAGIAAATPADGFDSFLAWLQAGYAGEMAYLHRHAEARRHPESVLAAVRSVVMLGMNYKPDESAVEATLSAKVARYA